MKPSNFYVYKHTSPSGKVYIGITCQAPERRWRSGEGYRQNEHFYNAIQRYGWDNFLHEIVAHSLTRDEACALEIVLIRECQSTDMAKGYNQSLGGEHGELCAASRAKLSESMRALWDDPAYRLHMSAAHKGSARVGWNHTGESREKMRRAALERYDDPEYRARCSASAKRRATTPEGRAQCSEKAKRLWANSEKREQLRRAKLGNCNRAKRVQCIETGEIFPSTKAAAKSVGASRDAIGQVCRGVREASHGYHWRYADAG